MTVRSIYKRGIADFRRAINAPRSFWPINSVGEARAAVTTIPDGAIVQRDGAYVLDRAGNYVINVAQS